MSEQQHEGVATLGFDADRLGRIKTYFDRYIESRRLPCYHLQVVRHDEIAYSAYGGMRDIEAGSPITADTLYRIYSMTKPITSVGLMMLLEQGLVRLDDPLEQYIPAFANPRVFVGGSPAAPVTRPATEPIRIRHLLSHTAGLGYGFRHAHPTDELLSAAGYEFGAPAGATLTDAVEAFAAVPLQFDPGTSWNYSIATDVLGRVIEVVTGTSLGDYLGEQVFVPLGMTHTAFHALDPDRLTALYYGVGGNAPTRIDTIGAGQLSPPAYQSGGGGLVSSMADYTRFTRMLLRGGELDGVRLISPRTLTFMTRNHLPGGTDLGSLGTPLYAESPLNGVGFGLGFSVAMDPAAAGIPSSVGEYGWGGAASTVFWIDPLEDLSTILMTQLMPSNAYPIRNDLRALVYGALVDPVAR